MVLILPWNVFIKNMESYIKPIVQIPLSKMVLYNINSIT